MLTYALRIHFKTIDIEIAGNLSKKKCEKNTITITIFQKEKKLSHV